MQGGSSITQQLAKNLFLNNERTIERKVKEAFLAIWLETRLTKNEILKLYLDRAYMGGGAFGVDAAAQYYFNKSARDVNLAEAAMLAGLFKAPTRFAPHVNLPAARARANIVLDNLVEAGFMTEGQVFGARRNPATAVDRRDERVAQLLSRLGVRRDEEARRRRCPKSRARARVRGAHRPRRQPAARGRERGRVDARASTAATTRRSQAAAVVLGPRRRGARDGRRARLRRRASSTARPTRCASPAPRSSPTSTPPRSSNGFKPTSIVVDAPICIGNWCPQNYSHSFSGSMTLTQALVRSINTIPVRLSIALGNGNPKVGRAKIIQTRAARWACARRCPIPPRCRSAPPK